MTNKFKLVGMIVLITAIILSFAACGNSGGGSGDQPFIPAALYTVTFNSNGGTAVSPIANVASGSKINELAAASTKGSYGTLDGWYKDADLTNMWNFASDTVTSDITLYAKWNADYSLGDDGPGGGKIFYRSETGFTMTDDDSTAYYLEAALANMPSICAWVSSAEYAIVLPGPFGTAIGTGRKNTALILETDVNAPAAKACVSPYNNAGGAKTDWFLPSWDELDMLYENMPFVGASSFPLVTFWYWSSSQTAYDKAYAKNFNAGNGGPDTGKVHNSLTVRAIRAF